MKMKGKGSRSLLAMLLLITLLVQQVCGITAVGEEYDGEYALETAGGLPAAEESEPVIADETIVTDIPETEQTEDDADMIIPGSKPAQSSKVTHQDTQNATDEITEQLQAKLTKTDILPLLPIHSENTEFQLRVSIRTRTTIMSAFPVCGGVL